MHKWNGRTTPRNPGPLEHPHCKGCQFYCTFCDWRVRELDRQARMPVLDVSDPAALDALFSPRALSLATATDAELERGDARCDQIREERDLYGSYDSDERD